MRGKPLVLTTLFVVVVASLWYVQAPPRSQGAYRERAADTAESLRSQVQSTRIWLRTLESDDATRSAAGVAFLEAEEDADRAISSFERYEPPVGSDRLRTDLSTLGGKVTEELSAVRIAAQRGEWQRLGDRESSLPGLASRLDELERRARP